MTPKEKAKELVNKMFGVQVDNQTFHMYNTLKTAKYSALITVDEIIKRTRSVNTMPPNCQKIDDNTKEYWQEVKQEIEKL